MGNGLNQFDETGQMRLASASVPREFAGMIQEQAALISNRQRLQGFWNYFERVTNDWKGNTLAVWPAYHGGNMISNYYLNWLGGMQDASKYSLAAKIQRGATGRVYSPWTGQYFEYDALRQLMAAHEITHGYFRSNMGDEVDRVRVMGDNPYQDTTRQTMHMIYDDLKDITGNYERSIAGVGKAVTGWNSSVRDLIRTDYLFQKALVPVGGPDAILNRIGFNIGSFIEENARAANFLDGILNKGLTAEQAAINVRRVLFDYRKFTVGRRATSAVFPFYEFPVQNTIFHLQMAATGPGRLSAPFRIAGRAQAQIDMQDVPSWKRDRLLVDIEGTTYDLSRYFPIVDFIESQDLIAAGIELINPFAQLLVELGFNYDTFRGREIAANIEAGDTSIPYSVPLADVNVNVNPKGLHFFRSLYRAFSEFERFEDDPSWRTMIGLREVELDRPRNLWFDLRDAREAREDALRELYSRSRTPIEGRAPYTAEQKWSAQTQVARESMRIMSLLADQYVTGEVPFEGGAIPMWSPNPRVLSKSSILGEINQLLIGTAGHPEIGLLETVRRTEDDELLGWVLGAIEENTQQRALLRLVLAADEWGPYANEDAIERDTPGYEAYQESKRRATDHYDAARGYIENTMMLQGMDDVWRVAHYELIRRMLRERTDTLGYNQSNLNGHLETLQGEYPQIHALWERWESASSVAMTIGDFSNWGLEAE